MSRCAVADEATITNLAALQGHHGAADRSAQDDRGAGEAAHRRPASRSTTITGSIHSPEPGSVEMLMELAYRLAIEESPFIQAIRNNVIVVITPTTEVDGHEKRGRQPARAAARASRRRRWSTGASTSQHDNNRDGIGMGLKLYAEHARRLPRPAPDGAPRPARVGQPALHVDGHRSLQPDRRPDPGQRVVVAGAERDHGDDQARRARRVDLQLLRRLGAELHVLDRRHATTRSAASTRRRATARPGVDAAGDEPRVVPAEPDPGDVKWSAARQREHAGVGDAHHAEQRREEQGDVPRELLPKNKHKIERGKTKAPYAYVIPAEQRKRVGVGGR